MLHDVVGSTSQDTHHYIVILTVIKEFHGFLFLYMSVVMVMVLHSAAYQEGYTREV